MIASTPSPEWAALCDQIDDTGRYPRERVDWLRKHGDRVAVGMVSRAEPRFRGVVEKWWPPEVQARPETRGSGTPIAMLLVETEEARRRVWGALPAGFEGHRAVPSRRHPTLGRVVVAVRDLGMVADSRWPRWDVLYQERWALDQADWDMAAHTHGIGARFGDGGLEALLSDLDKAQP